MNGVAEITIKGQSYFLKFGVQACQLFNERTKNRGLEAGSMEANLASTTDLVYCGLYGYSFAKDLPVKSWEEAIDLFDAFIFEDNFADQIQKVTNVFMAAMYLPTDKKDENAAVIESGAEEKKTTSQL